MKRIYGIVLFFAFMASQTIFAQAPENEHVKTELVSEVESIQPGQAFWVAVNMELDAGWHTYWRQAGETGFATSIEWQLPEGFTASSIYWPVPEKFEEEGIVGFGYKNKAFLMVEIMPPLNLDLSKPVTLSANVEWLACKESCIPGEAKLELTLPVKETAGNFRSQWHLVFEAARNELPQSSSDWKVDAYVDNEVYGLLIEWQNNEEESKLPKSIQFFPYNSDIKLQEPQKLEKVPNKGYFLSLPLEGDIPEHLEGILVNPEGWVSGGKVKALAIDIKGHKDMPVITESESKSPTLLWKALFFAFIGGLILNLMPCVFPILGLKVMGFINYAGESRWKARMHGLVFTLGILVSFWALSGLLLLLRASGEHLGWGFQLQSPFFITFLCFLLLLLALNFLGTFEMGLSLMSAGGKLDKKSGYTGTFCSGILATVLATPCSAPFMGTALGFTLTQPPVYSLIIFTAMAIGMSAPYLVLAIAPSLLKYLPRPGAWMETFKQAMAFPLLATVVWLLWVFGHQTHHDALIGLLFGLLLASIAAWIYGRFAKYSVAPKKRHSAELVSAIFLITGAVLGYTSAKVDPAIPTTGTVPQHTVGGLAWEKFSTEHLDSLRAEGRAIYIDFTAAWCVNCQINKKNVFSSEKVIEMLKEKNVVLLHADWTKRNPEITKALQGYGRGAVPTNVYYPAGKNSEAIILPELLTPSIVLEVLK